MHSAAAFMNTECCAFSAALEAMSIIILRGKTCTVNEITNIVFCPSHDYTALMALGLKSKQVYSAALHLSQRYLV
jgi:hypothetical protein